MRAVVQKVSSAQLTIDGKVTSEIDKGLVILVGIEQNDSIEDVNWLCGKIARLRIFHDENNIMNRSVAEENGKIMVVSQFTLHASTKKGNRPSYIRAAKPEFSIPLYNAFVKKIRAESGLKVVTGEFGAYMKIHLVNDGPVTIIFDTKNKE